MEAQRFGFGASMPAANKFDPTDEDIVAYYLLPRAIGLPNSHAHAVIDADPYACPPWELLRRHGHGRSDHAFFFFFAAPRDATSRRVSRVVGPGGGGGVWRGQRGEDKALVIARGDDGGEEMTVAFRRNSLAYHRKGERSSSGWVMHEYQLVRPALRPGAVLARVRITERGKKMAKKERRRLLQEEEDAAVAVRVAAARVPGPDDQPGPGDCFVSESGDGHAAASVASQRSGVVDGEGFGNSYDFSEGFGSNYGCFDEGEGSGDNFLQEDGGGNGD